MAADARLHRGNPPNPRAGRGGRVRAPRRGVPLLRYAMVSQMVFTVMKLVFWQEVEAASFGILAAVIYALLRERRA